MDYLLSLVTPALVARIAVVVAILLFLYAVRMIWLLFIIELILEGWVAIFRLCRVPGWEARAAALEYREGRSYLDAGRLALAERPIESALDRFEALGWDSEAAGCYCALGLVAIGRGDYVRAERMLDAAVSIFERNGDIGSGEIGRGWMEDLGSSQYTLGKLRQAQGRLQEATYLLGQARLTCTRINPWSVETANCLYSLAGVYELQHQLDGAAQLYRDALDIYQNQGQNQGAAFCRHGLAKVRWSQGRLSEAASIVEGLLMERRGLTEQMDIPQCQITLGRICLDQSRLDEGALHLRQAAATLLQHRYLDDAATAEFWLAEVYLKAGRLEDAEQMLNVADEANRSGLAVHPSELDMMIRWRYARLAAASHDYVSALDAYDAATSVLEQSRAVQATSPDRVISRWRAEGLYLEAAVTALKANEVSRAYEYLLGAKAQETYESASWATIDEALNLPLSTLDRTKLSELLLEEARLQADLARGHRGKLGSLAAVRQDKQMLLDTLTADLGRMRYIHELDPIPFSDRLTHYEATLRTLRGNAPTVAAVQGALRERELLLDFLVHEKTAWLFLVTRDHLSVIPLVGPAVQEALHNARSYLTPAERSAEAQAQWRTQGGLTSWLEDSSQALIGDPRVGVAVNWAETVLISPPSSLDRWPWHRLWWQPTQLEVSHYRPLEEPGRKVALLPSAGLLPRIRAPVTEPARNMAWIIASDTKGSTPYAALEARWVAESYASVEGIFDPYEPGAYEHLTKYSDFVAGPPPKDEYLAIHLVCHGENGTILLLDQTGTAREVTFDVARALVARRAKLVVLSACWSGMSERRGTTAEWLGLATAFFQGGAKAVVVCQWPVMDLAAPFFFRALHAAWAAEGLAIGEAMIYAREALERVSWGDVSAASGGPAYTAGQRAAYRDGSYQALPEDLPKDGKPFASLAHCDVYALLGDPTIRTAARARVQGRFISSTEGHSAFPSVVAPIRTGKDGSEEQFGIEPTASLDPRVMTIQDSVTEDLHQGESEQERADAEINLSPEGHKQPVVDRLQAASTGLAELTVLQQRLLQQEREAIRLPVDHLLHNQIALRLQQSQKEAIRLPLGIYLTLEELHALRAWLLWLLAAVVAVYLGSRTGQWARDHIFGLLFP